MLHFYTRAKILRSYLKRAITFVSVAVIRGMPSNSPYNTQTLPSIITPPLYMVTTVQLLFDAAKIAPPIGAPANWPGQYIKKDPLSELV